MIGTDYAQPQKNPTTLICTKLQHMSHDTIEHQSREKNSPLTPLYVWNLHTRIFHWLLALLTISAISLGMLGDNELMVWHYRCGYALLGLVSFRIVIGLFSGDYANFKTFPLNPLRIKTYLQGKIYAGHNPVGVWMVSALLIAITVQAISGLFTSDGFWLEGSWVSEVDETIVSFASEIHGYGEYILTALIGLHLLGNAINSAWKKQALVKAMITGSKNLPEDASITPAKNTSWKTIISGLVVAVLIAWLASNP